MMGTKPPLSWFDSKWGGTSSLHDPSTHQENIKLPPTESSSKKRHVFISEEEGDKRGSMVTMGKHQLCLLEWIFQRSRFAQEIAISTGTTTV